MKRLSKLLKRHRRRPRPQSAGVYGPQCLEDRSLMASIHANLDGDVLVTFSAIGESGSQDVFARLQTEDGTTEQQVNVSTAGIQGNETAALGEDERFVVVWSGRGKGDGHGIFARVFFADGTRSDEILVAEDVSGDQESPAVAMDATGRFVVAWSGPGAGDSHGIFLRAFEANGTPRGDAVLVNANAALLQRGPSIDMNAAGQLLVAWESLGEDGNGWGVQAQRFNATLQPQGAAIKINTTTEHQQLGAEAVLADDGSAVVAFASQLPGNLWEVRERNLDTNGVPTGADVAVSTTALGGKPELDVVDSGDDRHVVTWAWGTRSGNGAGIFGRSIADGQPEDVPFKISDDTGANLVPSVAVDPQGDLLFAWSGARGGEPVSTTTREADRDRTLPVLTATLASPVAGDGTVAQVTLDVGLTDINPVTRLQVRLDGQAFEDLLTGADLRDDDFEISAAQLVAALGAALPGGQHTLGIQAQDDAGNLSTIVNVQFTLDLAPAITAALAEDNGLSTTDRITTVPTISGTITDVGAVTKLQASVDSLTLQDINTSTTDHRGSFTITQAMLETLLGGPIADGEHTVRVQATDARGVASQVVLVTFTLDRAAPTLNQPLNDLSFFEDAVNLDLPLSGAFSGQGLVFSVQQSTNNVLRTEVQGDKVVLDFLENRVGSVQITVRATKPNGLFTEDTFIVDVLQEADAPTVIHQLENLVLPNVNSHFVNGQPQTLNQLTSINLGGVFGDADEVGTLVRFDLANGMGTIGLELFNGATPQTVQNFISYINSGRYADSILHRTVPGFIVQGGGYVFEATNSFSDVDRQNEIVNEPGISNRRGTIAMAKLGGQANSATSEFFFNLGNNNVLAAPDSLDNQNGGFTAFGRVLGNGMALIDSLANLQARDLTEREDIMGNRQVEVPFNSGNFQTTTIREVLSDIPLNPTYTDLDFAMDAPVAAEDVVRFTNIALDPTLTGGKGGDSGLTITASSSSTGVVLVTVNNKRLTLDPVADGTATITVTATDSTNRSVTQTFTVTVVRPDTGMVNSIPSLTAPEWQTVREAPAGNSVGGPLRIWDVVRGTGELVDPGAQIDSGDRVTVHYTGWLASNGTQFDSSRSNAQPITFALSNLIQGWKETIPGMREGGIRRLDIPASLAYGANGQGSIPPNARLVFEIKMLDVASLTPLMLAGGEETAIPTFDEIASYNPRPLSPEMQELVLAAVDRLSATGLERQVASSLGNVKVQMADLPGSLLGLALADQIWLDADAAGQGWFFDSSPADDLEFIAGIASSSAAAGRIDLLSVVAHELGHVLGLPDLDVGESLMFESLGPGMRRVLDVSHP